MTLPIVIRIPFGGGIGAVEHHSESPENFFAHVAGLKVVSPGTPSDGYSLLREAIDSPDPVIFFEPKRRYWLKEEAELPVRTEPIGTAVVRRPGTTATLFAYGPMVRTCLDTAAAAEQEGWDLEVVDLRSLNPLDTRTIVDSVERTGRAVVVHEAQVFAGFGAELAAQVTEHAFYSLEAPVLRVGGFDVRTRPPSSRSSSCPTSTASSTRSTAAWRSSGDPRLSAPRPRGGPDRGEIVSWLVAVGDTVEVDQPVAEVETAKPSSRCRRRSRARSPRSTAPWATRSRSASRW